jgi:uncharacterized protein YgiM (DUF1202 family)
MRYLLLTLVLLAVARGSAADVLCVSKHTVHVLGFPSAGAIVRLDAPRDYPLLVVDDSGSYYEVSDYRGRTGWIDPADVSRSECVVVIRGTVNVRGGPGLKNEVLFKAQEGVTFAVLQTSGEWVEVRHETGKTGWIYSDLVWGAK